MTANTKHSMFGTMFSGISKVMVLVVAVAVILSAGFVSPTVAKADGMEWDYEDYSYDYSGYGYEDYSYSSGYDYEDYSYNYDYEDYSYDYGSDYAYDYEDYSYDSYYDYSYDSSDYYYDTSYDDGYGYTDYYDDYYYDEYVYDDYYYEDEYYYDTTPTYYYDEYVYDDYYYDEYYYDEYYYDEYHYEYEDEDRPNCVLEANDTTIERGQSVTLTWTATDATSATLTTFGGVSATSGHKTVSPTSTKSYTLSVSGPGGHDTCSITIHVEQDEDDEDVVCDISAEDTNIREDETTRIRWNSDNADEARLNQGIGAVAVDGSRTVSPNSDTTYTLTVENDDGDTDTCSVTIRVDEEDDDDDDISCELTASDRSIEEGDDVTLRWETDGDVVRASLNQGIGRVDEDGGSRRVSPDSDTTYRLTVEDEDGDEETCSVTIDVDDGIAPPPDAPLVYLSQLPYTGTGMDDGAMMSYWLMLIAAIGGAGYFFYGRIMPFAFAHVRGEDEEAPVIADEPATSATISTADVRAFVSALASGDRASVAHFSETMGDGILSETAVALDNVVRARAEGQEADEQIEALTAEWSDEKLAEVVETLANSENADQAADIAAA